MTSMFPWTTFNSDGAFPFPRFFRFRNVLYAKVHWKVLYGTKMVLIRHHCPDDIIGMCLKFPPYVFCTGLWSHLCVKKRRESMKWVWRYTVPTMTRVLVAFCSEINTMGVWDHVLVTLWLTLGSDWLKAALLIGDVFFRLMADLCSQ